MSVSASAIHAIALTVCTLPARAFRQSADARGSKHRRPSWSVSATLRPRSCRRPANDLPVSPRPARRRNENPRASIGSPRGGAFHQLDRKPSGCLFSHEAAFPSAIENSSKWNPRRARTASARPSVIASAKCCGGGRPPGAITERSSRRPRLGSSRDRSPRRPVHGPMR